MIKHPEKLPTVNGYEYAGFWNLRYRFRKLIMPKISKETSNVYQYVEVTESYIADESYLFMLEHDLSLYRM